MKAVVALCLLALFAGAFAAQLSDSSYRTLWDAWRRQHKKSYADHEHNYRFGVWRRNLDAVLEHNAAGHSYELGMNHLADLSNAEYRALMLATHVPQLPRAEAHVSMSSAADLPDSFDWRTKNAVTPVKDQGQCGSCWTFSTTGAVEGAWAIAKNSLVSLSEQNLVDCSHECDPQNPKDCNNGCNGGLMEQAYEYIINNKGIDTEACYPYKGVDGTCSFKTGSCVGATISSYKAVASGDEAGLADAIANHGPVAVAIDASSFSFQLYSGGVYHPKSCKTAMDELDHGVLVVGYSSSDKGKYWIVKNSWGPKWGLSGYIWMAKDAGNVCGIATYASYPVV